MADAAAGAQHQHQHRLAAAQLGAVTQCMQRDDERRRASGISVVSSGTEIIKS